MLLTASLLAFTANAQSPQGAAADAPMAQSPTATPTLAPTPVTGSAAVASATATAEGGKKEPKVHLKGLDLGVTFGDASGLYFHKESYYNVLNLQLDLTYAVGRQLAGKDSWWAELALAARLPIEFELSSSEPGFRGTTFTSATLYSNPESIPISEAQNPQSGQIDGAVRRPVRINDLWVQLAHSKLVTIPLVGLNVGASLRFAVPTSIASRNSGLVTAPSLGVSIGRELGPVELGYDLRFTKYAFTRNQAAIVGTQNTVLVNGKEEPTWRPESTGVTNPDYGFVQGLTGTVHLPKGFAVTASYFLFHVKPLPLSGCDSAGVPGSNVCTDGALVGPVVQNAWRHEQAFAASVDYDAGPMAISLGLATLRGLWASDGTVAQPFVFVNAYNYTTVSLSLSTSPELILRALDKE